MQKIKIKNILPLFLFVFIYLILRLQNLDSIPVFGDEAIYIRWSQLIKNVETLRFVPLSDGKQPLFMWITAVLLKFINDPLIAGRMLSVFSGLFILISLYLTNLFLFNFQLSVISSLLYLLLPFTFFFDRMALPDNLLSFFGIISLFFTLLLSKYPRLDISIILGFFLGLSWLTKSPAIYFIFLSFLSYFIYDPKNIKKFYYPVISGVIAFFIYNILRLGPQFHQIALRNRDYVWPLTELLKHPLDPLLPHLKDILTIYLQYISLPILLIGITGLILKIKKTNRNNLNPKILFIIFLWWLLPLITNLTISKVFTARYVLFTTPPLIILLSLGIYKFFLITGQIYFNKHLKILIIILISTFNIYWIYRISLFPFYTRLPATESGYLIDWTSGWGIKDFSKYLIDRSQKANVIVGTEGYFGTLPDGLQIYTDGTKNLTIFGVGIDLIKIPDKLIDAKNHGDEVYLLINKSRLKLINGESDKLTLVNFYKKPDNDQLLLFKVN